MESFVSPCIYMHYMLISSAKHKRLPIGETKIQYVLMHPWLVRCDQNTDLANCRLLLDVKLVLLFFLNYENNIAESNCDTCWSADGGDINLHAEWPCNFHDNILSLTLQLIKYTKLGAFSSQNREYALHVNITCSILSTKIILFTVEHVFLHYKP